MSEVNPGDPGTGDPVPSLLDEGWARLAAQDHGSARRAARAVLARAPDNPEAHMILGLAELGDGDREAALEAFAQASALDPSYLAPVLYSAEALAADPGRLEDALSKVELAYTLTDPHTPEHVDVVLLHASLLRGGNQQREARRQLLQLRPTDLTELDQRVHAARLALDLGATPFARDMLSEAEGPEAAAPDVLHLLAQVAEREGDIEQALSLHLRVLAADRAGLAERRLLPPSQVTRLLRQAIANLEASGRGVVAEAEIRVRDLPPEELVADGLDPRLPLLLTGPPVPCAALQGRPRAYHLFVYRANLEPGYGLAPSVEALLAQALATGVAQFVA